MINFFKSALGRIFSSEKKESVQSEFEASEKSVHEQVEKHDAPVALTIWTIERNRLSAARALSTEIEIFPTEAVQLCEDILGYIVDTPNGESVVVEARTGSLVGHSLEVVKDGVREMTRSQLNTQLDTARREFNRMSKVELSNDEFWKAIKMGGNEIEISQDFQE